MRASAMEARDAQKALWKGRSCADDSTAWTMPVAQNTSDDMVKISSNCWCLYPRSLKCSTRYLTRLTRQHSHHGATRTLVCGGTPPAPHATYTRKMRRALSTLTKRRMPSWNSHPSESITATNTGRIVTKSMMPYTDIMYLWDREGHTPRVAVSARPVPDH